MFDLGANTTISGVALWKRQAGHNGLKEFGFEMSSDGGANWTEVRSFTSFKDPAVTTDFVNGYVYEKFALAAAVEARYRATMVPLCLAYSDRDDA